MFDEYGNPIGPVRTGYPFNSPFAPTAQDASWGMPFGGSLSDAPTLGPGTYGPQIPYNTAVPAMVPGAQAAGSGYSGYTHSFAPITGISAGNQNEFFQMPGLGQEVYGLGGTTDYTGGFNVANANPLAYGPTMQDFPTEFRSLEGIQEFGMGEEADIPLAFKNSDTLSGIQEMGLLEEEDIGLDFNNRDLRRDKRALEKANASAASTATDSAGKLNMQSAGMIASGVLGVAGGVTDIIQGGKNMRSAQAEQAKRQSEIDRLKASQPSLSTPAEYYERVKNAYDSRLMQMRTEDINRGLANTTAAAASFGSRGLGALAGATQSANRAQREEVLQQQQLQTSALGDLAAAQERTLGMQEARNVRETEYAQSALETAQQNELLAQQQRMAGIASTVGGVAQIGLGAINPVPLPMAEGGKVQKTPGKFSHEENEMAVITEDGEDTGVRVTGGEYVLNPEQAESIKKLVESGDKDALMRYMDDLLDEPQFA